MRNYKYGKGSLAHIATTTKNMQALCHRAMEIINRRKLDSYDIGITAGLRTNVEQFDLYKKGRTEVAPDVWEVTGNIVTNCDGYIKKSVHQSGNAIDYCVYVNGKPSYDKAGLAFAATAFFEAASELKLDIDWGGSFRSISDLPHIEIKGSF